MKVWPHPVKSYSKHEVKEFCVENQEWQTFRLTLKGLSTEDKLDKLQEYRSFRLDVEAGPEPGMAKRFLPRKFEVRIDNYLQALHRGGLLKPHKDELLPSSQFEVVK